jgi:hypothetical protein
VTQPALRLGDETFTVGVDDIPGWAMVRLAKANRQFSTENDWQTYLAGLYDFLDAVLAEGEMARLNQAFSRAALTVSDIDSAVGALISELVDRPTVPSKSSDAGRPTTKATSRVVSLSPGTSRAASADGARSAS